MSEQYVLGLIKNARAAQAKIENFTQEQIDDLVYAIGKVTYDNRETLARMAHE